VTTEPVHTIEIGIDIGGTFTDVVAIIDAAQIVYTKVPSTPKNLVQGVRLGTEKVLRLAGRSPAEVTRFIHGTTVATNAVLERRGAPIAVLMTEGFRDTLEMGRQKRTEMYNLFLDVQTPVFLAPRHMRFDVPERLDASGGVVRSLDEQAVRAIAKAVVAGGAQAVAVCYLFSFLNPAHECRTREIFHEVAPAVHVSLSSDVDPKFREYERLCVTAFDAYVRPVIDTYLKHLEQELASLGMAARLQVIQSRGGLTTAPTVRQRPVTMLKSGLAGGVLGAKFAGERGGFGDLMTLDMGGTSNDVALVASGKPLISFEGEMGGYPLRVPMVDVSTIGAGGGSIAWLDPAGGLRVGPQSAGAEPGPACYGRGGEQATVTDASVVLGYLNPEYFAGGELKLNATLAREAVERLASRLGLDPLATAAGIHRIVNARMADQMRLASIRRGYDPRQFVLVALGGAGPVHAGRLAQELEIPTVLIPETPGVLSAFGLLVAAFEHDHRRPYTVRATALDFERVNSIFRELDEAGREKMRADGIAIEAVTVARSAEMRYVGQGYELEIPMVAELTPASLSAVLDAFHARHAAIYGHHNAGAPIEFTGFRTVHSYQPPRPTLQPAARRAPAAPAGDSRPAYFSDVGLVAATPVYQRADLVPGTVFDGPAIVEQADTTTVVYGSQCCEMDSWGNLLIRAGGTA
jgi:N-methylhydantoinase A